MAVVVLGLELELGLYDSLILCLFHVAPDLVGPDEVKPDLAVHIIIEPSDGMTVSSGIERPSLLRRLHTPKLVLHKLVLPLFGQLAPGPGLGWRLELGFRIGVQRDSQSLTLRVARGWQYTA